MTRFPRVIHYHNQHSVIRKFMFGQANARGVSCDPTTNAAMSGEQLVEPPKVVFSGSFGSQTLNSGVDKVHISPAILTDGHQWIAICFFC